MRASWNSIDICFQQVFIKCGPLKRRTIKYIYRKNAKKKREENDVLFDLDTAHICAGTLKSTTANVY